MWQSKIEKSPDYWFIVELKTKAVHNHNFELAALYRDIEVSILQKHSIEETLGLFYSSLDRVCYPEEFRLTKPQYPEKEYKIACKELLILYRKFTRAAKLKKLKKDEN